MVRRVVLIALFVSMTGGTPGALDRSFGRNGVVAVDVIADAGLAVAVQPDGKVVEVGYASKDEIFRYAVVRTDPDGRLDPTFGTSGVVTQYASNGAGYGVALQADGKIVVAGSATIDGLPAQSLVRFMPDGDVDRSFGTDGVVLNGAGIGATEVAIQPDGRIVTVGPGLLTRYHPDGSLDESFGIAGGAGTVADATDLAVLDDGRIVVAGADVSDPAVLVARHVENGDLDPAFGDAGIARVHIGQYVFTTALAVQPDGAIVAVGGVGLSSPNIQHYLIVRVLANGQPDPEFGSRGVVVTPIPGYHYARDVAVQEDGRIVVVGPSGDFPRMDFTVVRLLTDGSLDTSFGRGGMVINRVGGTGQPGTGPNAVVLQEDGKIVVAGTVQDIHHPSNDFALVRYLAA